MRLVSTKLIVAGFIFSLIANASVVVAHDYWLEPELYVFPSSDYTSMLHLHMGDHFTSEQERPLQLARTIRFKLSASGVITDLTRGAEDGRLPIMQFKPQRTGTHLIFMERTPQILELAAGAFHSYLHEEGLDAIIAMRKASGTDMQAGRETYTRYIKTLLQVGSRYTDDYKKVTGQRLEIVPLRNPYLLKHGETLPLKILFEGRPLCGARVVAHNRDQKLTLAAKTDKDGVARFPLSASGAWLVRLVHMRSCAGCADADWESFWGACTFAVS